MPIGILFLNFENNNGNIKKSKFTNYGYEYIIYISKFLCLEMDL